jgi:PPP family 3-phenylpropionic acid transporter
MVTNKTSLAPFGFIYAFHFSCVGILLTFLSPYLKSLGLSGAEVGMVLSLPSLARIISPLFWGYIADRLNNPIFILRVVIVLSLIVTAFFFWAGSFWTIALVLFIYAAVKTSVPSLTDAVCLGLIKVQGGEYSRVRVWGSIGFVVSALLTGFLMEENTKYAETAFGIMCLLYLGSLTSSVFIGSASIPTSTVNIGLIRALLKNPRLRVLFVASGIHWASTMPYHGFLPLRVEELSLSPSIAGAGFAFAGFTEILMMNWSGAVLRRWSARNLFIVSMALSSLRWLATAFATDAVFLIAIQGLHSFTFGAFYVAAIQILLEEIPDSLRATGQGLFFSVAFGLGGGLGVLLTGFVYNSFGGTISFLFGSALSLCATLVAKRL